MVRVDGTADPQISRGDVVECLVDGQVPHKTDDEVLYEACYDFSEPSASQREPFRFIAPSPARRS